MSEIVAVIAAGLFAAATMLAADPGKCAEHVAACKALVDKFNLTQVKKDAFKRTLDAYQSTGVHPGGLHSTKVIRPGSFDDQSGAEAVRDV